MGNVQTVGCRALGVVALCLTLALGQALPSHAGVVSGTLTTNAIWSPANNPYVITGTFTVASGTALTLDPGTEIQLNSNALFQINGSLFGLGSSAQTVTVTRMPANAYGGHVVVRGSYESGFLTSTLRLEHCSFNYLSWPSHCAMATYHTDVDIRHSTFDAIASTVMILTSSRVHVANNLFTNTGECVNSVYGYGSIVSNRINKLNGYADGIDLDLAWTNIGGAAGVTDIGWNILSNGSDPDADALDLGVANCIVHDNVIDQFGDKGISIGEWTTGHFFNNVISRCNAGLVVKDYSTPFMYNNTVVACNYGESSYQKYHGPAQGSLSNSIIWNCATNIALFDGSTLSVGNCIMNGTVWPGPGNTNLNPLFVNQAARDYRLQSNSPAIDSANAMTSASRDILQVPRPLDGDANGSALPDRGAYEFVHATADSDGDLMPDTWEIAKGVNAATNDTLEDADGDGSKNWSEFISDTDPSDPGSSLAITGVTVQSNGLYISWQGGQNARQILYFSENTMNFDGPWVPLLTNEPPTNPDESIQLPFTSSRGRYRIAAQQP